MLIVGLGSSDRTTQTGSHKARMYYLIWAEYVNGLFMCLGRGIGSHNMLWIAQHVRPDIIGLLDILLDC